MGALGVLYATGRGAVTTGCAFAKVIGANALAIYRFPCEKANKLKPPKATVATNTPVGNDSHADLQLGKSAGSPT